MMKKKALIITDPRYCWHRIKYTTEAYGLDDVYFCGLDCECYHEKSTTPTKMCNIKVDENGKIIFPEDCGLSDV